MGPAYPWSENQLVQWSFIAFSVVVSGRVLEKTVITFGAGENRGLRDLFVDVMSGDLRHRTTQEGFLDGVNRYGVFILTSCNAPSRYPEA